MSGTRNWNDMSSSDEDSWFDDDQPQDKKETEVPLQAETPAQGSNTTQKEEVKEKTQLKQTQNNKEKPVAKQGNERKQNFLKDEDLLIEYTNKKVDDPRVVKAVKVFNQQHKELLKSLKNARVKQVKEGIFILNFYEPQGVLEFIKQKIANRYRFFLQPFFKRKVQNQQQGKQGEERPRRQKKQRKRRYQEDREQDLKPQRENKEYKQHKKQKEDDKGKKVYIAKETFQIENNKNILNIKSQNFDIERVIEELQEKRVFKDFNKLRIKTPSSFMPKVNKLITEIQSRFSFYLDKQPEETNKEEVVELVLVQNKNKNVTKAKTTQAQKPKQQEKRYKEQQKPKPITNMAKTQLPPTRKLASNFDEYFGNISKGNLSQIVKGFNQDEYVKRLKQFNTAIQRYWNSWKIQGQQEHIQQLLKLVHRLKKSNIYDLQLKPGSRNQKAVLTAQVKLKQRRPKVDVSQVNNYLN